MLEIIQQYPQFASGLAVGLTIGLALPNYGKTLLSKLTGGKKNEQK